MELLKGRTAVITGAGGGIGLALAEEAAKERMNLVLADIDKDALDAAVNCLDIDRDNVLTVVIDVSRSSDVGLLRKATIERFGKVHLLLNNAGVLLNRRIWEYSPEDFDWLFGVNVNGVLYGIREFVPHMLQHGEPAHIGITASVAGFISPPGLGAYSASKHSVIAIAETLRDELKTISSIGVSVLCPAWVPTGIASSERSRPERFGTLGANEVGDDIVAAVSKGRLTPRDIARCAFQGIRKSEFYIFPHTGIAGAIRENMRQVLDALESPACHKTENGDPQC